MASCSLPTYQEGKMEDYQDSSCFLTFRFLLHQGPHSHCGTPFTFRVGIDTQLIPLHKFPQKHGQRCASLLSLGIFFYF